MSKFEFLPNEILLEVFEYLSAYDTFQSFYFLNKRYNTLLISLNLRIDLLNIWKKNFDYYNYFLFSLIPNNIIIFRCEDIFDRLIYQIHLSDFISLKYLNISNLNIENLLLVISKLNYLEKLIYLNLQTRSNIITEENIIFKGQLPLIQTCILNINKRIIFQDNYSYLNLQKLIINQCTIEDLLSFLHLHTPQLQRLTVTLIDTTISNAIDITHHLKSLTINTHSIPFRRLTNSIFVVFPYLQRLSLTAIGIDYANGKEWSTLLSTNFPDLICFQLHITFPQDDSPTSNDRLQLLQTFQTSYYRIHQFHFAIISRPSLTNIELFSLPCIDHEISFNLYQTQIDSTKIDRTIFKNTTELSLFLTNSTEHSNSFFPNVKNLKLISEFREYEPYPKSLFVDISRLTQFSQLNSLEFSGRNFPTTSLVLLDYTPNLHTLIIPLNCLIKMTKILSNENVCQRLTSLIKYLTIQSIDNVKNVFIFERLPTVFCNLISLSLSLQNPNDLYILMILILSKMARILKSMIISIDIPYDYNILDQFMIWLMDYMYQRDLGHVDVKFTDNQVCFCF